MPLNLYTPSYHKILTNKQLNPKFNACNHLSKLISYQISSEVPREEIWEEIGGER